jgi:hypothetical protein
VGTTKRRSKRDDRLPVYTYDKAPGGMPLVSIMKLGRRFSNVRPVAHSHDFLVLAYFERDGGSFRLGAQEWQIEAGDVYLIAPGEVVDASRLRAGLSSSHPMSWGPGRPAPSFPGAPTRCCSPSSGARREVPNA